MTSAADLDMPSPAIHTDVAGALTGMLDLSKHGDPAAIVDGQGRILSCNPLFSEERGLAQADGVQVSLPLLPVLEEAKAGRPRASVTLDGPQGSLTYDITLLSWPSEAAPLWLLLVTDRTMDVSLRNALVESRARFRDLVKISSDYAWETDAEGHFSMITPRGLAGRSARDLIGRSAEIILDQTAPPVAVLPFTTPTPVHDAELWLRHEDGRSLCFEISAVPLYDKDGLWAGARGVCRDVTQDRHYRTLMAQQRNRDRVFSRITSVFRREADPNDMLQAAASACTHGFVASGCQIFSAPPNLSGGTYRPQLNMTSAFGHYGALELAESALARMLPEISPPCAVLCLEDWSVLAAPAIYGGRLVGAILLWRSAERPSWTEGDIQLLSVLAGQLAPAIEQRSQHHLLLDASRTDALTSLLNRRGFYDEMKRRFNRLQRDNRPAALVYVDLDNFKLVNDSHGHARGDEALRHVADILRHNTRSTDLVARLGGDEFAIWLDNADEQVAVSRAQIFLTAATQLAPYSGDKDRPLKLSIGIAVHHAKDREDINQLMSRADAAMYAVKRGGKGNYAMAAPPASS
ncbi:MAG TPA: diguanylate cyclase [Candidatus Sulfotelmatobacter sp.]|jgi:diguanylate cyclase (GGDEF)-like protein/PAS domain S-box-containing protein|nr:diguanylate cyclase [Candidatus Sulfotelmatobacter sp.]